MFNGHYQEQEKMNVIQLYVNDSGSGTPFEEGLNTIVIPTSLFTETIFNAHVQNETLNATTIYLDNEELFKFISVGRDGDTEQACDEIDFIIIRFDISSEDAKEVLNLLLECLVNETTNETAIVYSYVSTKENGTAAVMMNLPFSVLGLIPWYCDFENSPMGSKPETFEDWFWKPLATIGLMIVGVIITIGMAFVELFMMMVDFFATIFMDILPIFAYILWLIISAIILIFVWIMFVIALIIFIGFFLLFTIPFISIGDLTQCTYEIRLNSLSLHNEDRYLEYKYYIGFEYFGFLKISLPTFYSCFTTENSSISLSYNLFKSFDTPSMDFISDLIYTDVPKSSSLKTSNLGIEELNEFKSTFLIAFDLVAIFVGIAGLTSAATKSLSDIIEWTLLFTSMGLLITGFVSVIISGLGKGKLFWIGFALGSMVSCLITAIIAGAVGSLNFKNKSFLRAIIGITTIIFSIIGLINSIFQLLTKFLNLDSDELENTIQEIETEITFSLITLISGAVLIGVCDKEDINKEIELYASFGIGFFFLFFLFALWDFVSEE